MKLMKQQKQLRELLKLRLENALKELIDAETFANESKNFVVESDIDYCIKNIEAILKNIEAILEKL